MALLFVVSLFIIPAQAEIQCFLLIAGSQHQLPSSQAAA
jgi:hypothetical protein